MPAWAVASPKFPAVNPTFSPALLRQLAEQRSGSRLAIHDKLLADDPTLPAAERALIGLRNIAQDSPEADQIAVRILWECRHALALVGSCGELSQRLTGRWLEHETVWRAKVERWAFVLAVDDQVDVDMLAGQRALDAEIELVTQLTRAAQMHAGAALEMLRHAVRQRSYKGLVQAATCAVFSAGADAAEMQVRDWLSAGELEPIVLEASGACRAPEPSQIREALSLVDFAGTSQAEVDLRAAVQGPAGALLVAQLYPQALELIDRIAREGTQAGWGWRKRDLQRFVAECRRQQRTLARD